jgi:hypothetical protein
LYRKGIGRALLVLDNANPTSCPAKSRAKPYIVSRRDAYFDGEMWSNAVRIIIFISEIFAKFGEKSAGIFVRDSPLCCILWVLAIETSKWWLQEVFSTYETINIKNLVTLIYAFRVSSSCPECNASDKVV